MKNYRVKLFVSTEALCNYIVYIATVGVVPVAVVDRLRQIFNKASMNTLTKCPLNNGPPFFGDQRCSSVNPNQS